MGVAAERLKLVRTDADGYAPILHSGRTFWVPMDAMTEQTMLAHTDWPVDNDPRSEAAQREEFAFGVEAHHELEVMTWSPPEGAGG